jgi:hypothetical protein
MASFWEVTDAVLAEIVDRVEEELGGELDQVVRGDRWRGPIPTPSVWVTPGEAAFVQAEYGDLAYCDLRVSIAALVKGSHPEEAGRLSMELCGRATDAVLREPLAEGTIDARPESFSAAVGPFDPGNRNLYGSEAFIRVSFEAGPSESS